MADSSEEQAAEVFYKVILKKGVTKNQVAERLHGVFMDSPVDVAACSLVWE